MLLHFYGDDEQFRFLTFRAANKINDKLELVQSPESNPNPEFELGTAWRLAIILIVTTLYIVCSGPKFAEVRVADMSFVSDKELLRKAATTGRKTARNGTSRSGETTKVEDVVETAKIERELRKLQREQRVYVVKIQAWWRGRLSSFRYILELKGNVDKRLADIENLARMLSQKGGVTFVPPADIAIVLCRSLLAFGMKGKEVRFTKMLNQTRIISKLFTHTGTLNHLPNNAAGHSEVIKDVQRCYHPITLRKKPFEKRSKSVSE
jgi:hypothetical protein